MEPLTFNLLFSLHSFNTADRLTKPNTQEATADGVTQCQVRDIFGPVFDQMKPDQVAQVNKLVEKGTSHTTLFMFLWFFRVYQASLPAMG